MEDQALKPDGAMPPARIAPRGGHVPATPASALSRSAILVALALL